MELASKFKIRLKKHQTYQLGQFSVAILAVLGFFGCLFYFRIVDSDELPTFAILVAVFGVLGFGLQGLRTTIFFRQQVRTYEKTSKKIKSLAEISKRKESFLKETEQLLANLSAKEELGQKTRKVLKEIACVVSATQSGLFIPKNGQLVLSSSWGVEPEMADSIKISLNSRSAVSRSFKTGEIIISNRPSSDARFNQKLVNLVGAKHAICIPLKIGEEIYGVLVVVNKIQEVFDKEDLAILTTLSFPMASRLKQIYLEEKFDQTAEEEYKFLTDFAHQIKTPLTSAYGELEFALAKKDTAIREKAIEFAMTCLKKSSKAIQEALVISSIKSEEGKLEKVDLHQILEEACEIACMIAEQKGITINFNGVSKIHTLADHDKILQVVMNVLDNAVRYTQTGGKITVDLKKKDNQAMIIVKDTGVGIPKKEISRVFERFWRGQIANNQEGSGLGLPIAKSTIEMYGGTIGLSSHVGRGTQIKIQLPLEK